MTEFVKKGLLYTERDGRRKRAAPEGTVAEAFSLDTEEGHTDRRTFVLADGVVFATYNPELTDPAGHAREVLNDIRNEFITGG